jgi:Putative prokaryotic signal transducing protein
MKAIRGYPTQVEADLDRLTLEAAGIPAVVVGVGAAMEGGIAGVTLLVPEDLVERALRLLEQR